MWGYWQVLGYEHYGMAAEAEPAKTACARQAQALRAYLAEQGRTPAEEDAEIALVVREARRRFAADLAAERQKTCLAGVA